MSLQPLHGKWLAFEIDNQRCGRAAVEREFDPALQIALQGPGRPALDRRATSLPDYNRVVLDRHLPEAQNADRRLRAAHSAQVSQQALLAAEKPFAQEGKTERRQAPRGFAGKGFREGPSIIHGR